MSIHIFTHVGTDVNRPAAAVASVMAGTSSKISST